MTKRLPSQCICSFFLIGCYEYQTGQKIGKTMSLLFLPIGHHRYQTCCDSYICSFFLTKPKTSIERMTLTISKVKHSNRSRIESIKSFSLLEIVPPLLSDVELLILHFRSRAHDMARHYTKERGSEVLAPIR